MRRTEGREVMVVHFTFTPIIFPTRTFNSINGNPLKLLRKVRRKSLLQPKRIPTPSPFQLIPFFLPGTFVQEEKSPTSWCLSHNSNSRGRELLEFNWRYFELANRSFRLTPITPRISFVSPTIVVREPTIPSGFNWLKTSTMGIGLNSSLESYYVVPEREGTWRNVALP